MYSIQDFIDAGYGGYAGWGVEEANADFQATNGSGKQTSGGSTSGAYIPPFNWTEEQQKAAEAKAIRELEPYYTKLLQMYGGDVALAKQRMDQDYERGLRVQTENIEWAKETNDISLAERQRKFQLALKDMDQQLNQRGVFTSGIRTQDTARATAEEQYQQNQILRENEALDTGLKQYTEGANVDYQREAERLGYAKPTTQAVAGQYAPSQTGITSPGAAYNVSNFTAEPAQKELAIEEQKRQAMYEKALNTRNQAYQQWASDATRLAQMG